MFDAERASFGRCEARIKNVAHLSLTCHQKKKKKRPFTTILLVHQGRLGGSILRSYAQIVFFDSKELVMKCKDAFDNAKLFSRAFSVHQDEEGSCW